MSKRDEFKKQLLKKKNKILTIQDLKKIGQKIMTDEYADTKLYKLIYHAKNQWYFIAIKKDLFVPTAPDHPIDEQSIIDKYYRPLLKKHCADSYWRHRYIGGLKALELITGNYTPTDTIEIVTSDSQGSSVLFLDKKIYTKSYTQDGTSLFKTIYRQTENIKIGTTALRRATLELAILESLYSPDVVTQWYTHELIKRALKKYKKHIRSENIITLVRLGKHHSSLNRLHQIARSVDAKLATQLEDIIRKYSFIVDI